MKKSLALFTVIASIAISSNAFAAIGINVDGKPLTMDVPPQIVGGRTLVPVRAIFESLGANIAWDDNTKTVTATTPDKTIQLTLNSANANINGTPVTLDVPAQSINGRTMVPARFVAEALGCAVDWDSQNQIVKISKTKDIITSVPSIIFTTNGETNGLQDTFMYASGTVGAKQKLENVEYLILNTPQGDIGIMKGNIATDQWDALKAGTSESVSFLYLGYSSKLDVPMGAFTGLYNPNKKTEGTEPQKGILDGKWCQAAAAANSTYQVAYIRNGAIKIYWVTEDGTEMLYWAGSCEIPKDSKNFTWTSKNDTSKTSGAILASDASSKEFEYKNGKISYKVSAMGVTQTITLEKISE